MGPYLFNTHPWWSVVFWLSYAAVFAAVLWVARRERGQATGEIRDRGSRGVIYLATFIGLALAFAGPTIFPRARIGLLPVAVFGTAIAAIWFGTFLYVWAATTLGSFFRTTVQLLEGQALVTRGPYRLVRHPAYLGGILIFSGVGLATGNWFSFVACTLILFAGYARRIQVEEVALSERFGAAFAERKKRAWAVLPLVW